MIDARQLRSFVEIVERGSITAAADRLGIAQPALSRQVKALERALAVPLLLRHGRGVAPTEEGVELAGRARAILADLDALAGAFSGAPEALAGRLTLGLPPTVAAVLATRLLERAMDRFPKVQLRIVSGFSGHVEDWLRRGAIDLGVAYAGQGTAALRAQPVIRERLFLVAAPGTDGADGPVEAEAALAAPLVLPNPEHGLRGRIEAIAAERGVALRVAMEIDILPTMLAFVERGVGATILPLVSVAEAVRAGRLVARPIRGRGIDRTLVLLTHRDRPGSRLSAAMARFVTDEVHALASTGAWPGTTL